jgi:hypothetical protein
MAGLRVGESNDGSHGAAGRGGVRFVRSVKDDGFRLDPGNPHVRHHIRLDGLGSDGKLSEVDEYRSLVAACGVPDPARRLHRVVDWNPGSARSVASLSAIGATGEGVSRITIFSEAGELRSEFFQSQPAIISMVGFSSLGDVVQVAVVDLLKDRLHRGADERMVVEPAGFGIDLALDRDFDRESVAVESLAHLCPAGTLVRALGGFEDEIFG